MLKKWYTYIGISGAILVTLSLLLERFGIVERTAITESSFMNFTLIVGGYGIGLLILGGLVYILAKIFAKIFENK